MADLEEIEQSKQATPSTASVPTPSPQPSASGDTFDTTAFLEEFTKSIKDENPDFFDAVNNEGFKQYLNAMADGKEITGTENLLELLETISKTAETQSNSGTATPNMNPEELLEQLEGDEQLKGMLDNLLENFMSKDMLYEPVKAMVALVSCSTQ